MSFFATNLKKAALCTFLSFILVAGLMPVGAVASEENDLVGIAETLPENLVEENSDGETLDSYDEYNTEKQEEDVLGSSSQEAFEEDSTKDEATTQEISKTTTEEVKPFANNLQSGNIQLVSKAHNSKYWGCILSCCSKSKDWYFRTGEAFRGTYIVSSE